MANASAVGLAYAHSNRMASLLAAATARGARTGAIWAATSVAAGTEFPAIGRLRLLLRVARYGRKHSNGRYDGDHLDRGDSSLGD